MTRRITLLAILVLLSLAAAAKATPQQGIADRLEAWITKTTGQPALNRPIQRLTGPALEECNDCLGEAYPDKILLGSYVWRGLTKEAAPYKPTMDPPEPGPFHILLHELLHRTGQYGPNEEALVDAVAMDLAPAASTAVLGITLRPTIPVYGDGVSWVRRQSAKACGCKWRSYGARMLRRQWWLSGDATRAEALR